MKVASTAQGGEFEQPKPGVELALAYRIIDLGTQPSTYNNIAQTPRRKLYIGWELPDQPMDDGKPHITGNFYSYMLGTKANLRKDLNNWRGKPFTDAEIEQLDLEIIFTEPFMITLVEAKNGKVYPQNISAVPARMKPDSIETVNEHLVFSLEPDEYNDEAFERLPDGFKRMVAESPEYQRIKGTYEEPAEEKIDMPGFAPPDAEFTDDNMEDEIPF